MKKTLQDSKKFLNLLGVGLDDALATRVLKKGYSLTKLKSVSKSELEKVFNPEEVQKLQDLKRKPIPKDIVQELTERCHWKCCVCWDYQETKPVIIHHIDEHSKSQDDSYENLVVLCLNHHAEAHSEWTISRHPLPPELIRTKKKDWELAILDFVAGRRSAPSSKFNIVANEANDSTSVWLKYLQGIMGTYANWHIPNELISFIDWEVRPVPVNDYISLKLISEKPLFPHPLVKTALRNKTENKTELLKTLTNKEVLIIGSAGTGKSTCLRYLCYHYASTALKSVSQNSPSWHPDLTIPILISLRHFGKNDFGSLLNSQLHRYGNPNNFHTINLSKFKFLLLLDGLDEVQPKWREDLLNEIDIYTQTFPNIRIVITSRKQPSPELLKGFVWYEIEELKQESILQFAEAYLGYRHRYAFMHFIEQNRLEDVIRTPLLLTFCLVLFKQDAGNMDNLADVYKQILHLYKMGWENRRKNINNPKSIDWMILERTLALLAYQMETNNLGLTVTREQALYFLGQETKALQEEHLWSSDQTTLDLLSQLLFHNLLEASENVFGFWHASFQDFFTAIHISKFPIEKILQLANEILKSQTLAFLGGMLEDPTPLVEFLITNVREAREPSQAIQSLEILGSMGEKFTHDIIRAVSEPSFLDVHYYVYSILETRIFEGKSIFQNVFRLLSTIEDTSQINFNIFTPLYKNTLLSISHGDIDTAKKLSKQLFDYIDRLAEEKLELDRWLMVRNLTDLQEFTIALRKDKVSSVDLLEFCRNTVLHSSLPFLGIIDDYSQDFALRMEANLAIQGIIRQ